MKISDYPAASALTGTEIVPISQGGVTVKATTAEIAALGGGGSAPVDSVNGQTGTVVLGAADVGAEPSGAAASAVSDHNANPGAHGGVEAAFASHNGAGGSVHSLATETEPGFAPIRSGEAEEYLAGDGQYRPLSKGTALITSAASPYTVDPSNNVRSIMVDLSGGNVVINLPDIESVMPLNEDLHIGIYGEAAGHTLTINDSNGLINGQPSIVLDGDWDSVVLRPWKFGPGPTYVWSIK